LLHITRAEGGAAVCAESAGALLNLAAIGSQHAQEAAVGAMVYLTLSKEGAKSFIRERGPLIMVRVLADVTSVAAEMAASILANVSVDAEGRQACLDAGGATVLTKLMQQTASTTKAKEAAVAAFVFFTQSEDGIRSCVGAGAAGELVKVVVDPEASAKRKEVAAGALRNIVTMAEGRSAVILVGGPLAMMKLLTEGDLQGQEMAAMVLCELTQDEAGRQACMEVGALSRPRPVHKPKQKRYRQDMSLGVPEGT